MSSRAEKILFGILFSVILFLGGARLLMDGTHAPIEKDMDEGQKNSKVEEIATSPKDAQKKSASGMSPNKESTEQNNVEQVASSSLSTVTVYVGGAVQKPGLYTLEANKRVQDALQAAGNLTDDGALGAINPAQHLTDEMQIIVPTKEEVAEANARGASSLQGISLPKDNNEQTGSLSEVQAKININTASAEELQRLPSIGKTKAENILRYREKKPFQTEEEIMNVSGIGKKVFEQIQPQICVK